MCLGQCLTVRLPGRPVRRSSAWCKEIAVFVPVPADRLLGEPVSRSQLGAMEYLCMYGMRGSKLFKASYPVWVCPDQDAGILFRKLIMELGGHGYGYACKRQ
jgi:hypothetical protein